MHVYSKFDDTILRIKGQTETEELLRHLVACRGFTCGSASSGIQMTIPMRLGHERIRKRTHAKSSGFTNFLFVLKFK